MEKHDIALGRLLRNTKRANVSRNASIADIAADIETLSAHYGSVAKVAELLSITSGMLQKFLAVKKLEPSVQDLVRSRTLDSVEAVVNLAKYPPKVQMEITKALLEKRITAHDLKSLRPLFLAHPNKEAAEVVALYADSKNKKVAVIKFEKSNLHSDLENVRHNFSNLIGIENLLSLDMTNGWGNITISKKGEMLLREVAKNQKQTLHQLISNLL